MKSMQPPSAAIFYDLFLQSGWRGGGAWYLGLPGLATVCLQARGLKN